MNEELDDLARKLNVYVAGDTAVFQRKARVLQSLWRERQGYAPGTHRSCLLGSRLAMPWAKESLANFLTDNIRQVVRDTVSSQTINDGRLIEPNRFYGNLLSSQPLCFNLFSELALDLDLASRMVSRLTGGRFAEVTGVDFEYSPGRSDPRYTDDRSAFDVYLSCRTRSGAPAFLGVEVKYHESLQDKAGRHRPRYDEVAAQMGCFVGEKRERLRETPLQQIWRDHLLAGALRMQNGFSDAAFVFLYPRDNACCHEAVQAYASCLSDQTTFMPWTLENLVAALDTESGKEWIARFKERYLAFDQLPL